MKTILLIKYKEKLEEYQSLNNKRISKRTVKKEKIKEESFFINQKECLILKKISVDLGFIVYISIKQRNFMNLKVF